MGSTSCKDVDECKTKTANCDSVNAVCTNLIGGFSCNCKDGFCGNGSTCVKITSVYNENIQYSKNETSVITINDTVNSVAKNIKIESHINNHTKSVSKGLVIKPTSLNKKKTVSIENQTKNILQHKGKTEEIIKKHTLNKKLENTGLISLKLPEEVSKNIFFEEPEAGKSITINLKIKSSKDNKIQLKANRLKNNLNKSYNILKGSTNLNLCLENEINTHIKSEKKKHNKNVLRLKKKLHLKKKNFHIIKHIKQNHKVNIHKTKHHKKHHKNNIKNIHKQKKTWKTHLKNIFHLNKSSLNQHKNSLHINKHIKQNHKVKIHKTKHQKKHHKNNSKTIHKQTKNFMKSLTQQKKVLCTLINR